MSKAPSDTRGNPPRRLRRYTAGAVTFLDTPQGVRLVPLDAVRQNVDATRKHVRTAAEARGRKYG